MENKDLSFKGVTDDSRKVQSDYVFIAIQGESRDGNEYIQDAINKGAKLIITERDLDHRYQIPYLKVEDARAALANLNALLYSTTQSNIRVIGVTGTNGKTTTTHMIEAIFREAGRDIALLGGQGLRMGGLRKESSLTTPSSEEINKFLFQARKRGVGWAVMEVSSHGLKQKRVEGIQFDTAIFTNISRDHLDYHGNLEDYIHSKSLLFKGLKENTRAIINGDDPHAFRMIEGKRGIYVISYGLKSKSTITASSIDMGNGIRFNYCLQRSLDTYRHGKIEVQEFPIEVKLLGYHNIYNALAAITTGLIYEVSIQDIQRALRGFSPVARRLEYTSIPPYYVLDDYAHNPSSLEAAFQSLQSINYQDLYVLVALRGGRGEEINRENAEIIANWCTLLKVRGLYITESRDCVDLDNRVQNHEREGFLRTLRKRRVPYRFHTNLRNSIQEILRKTKGEDLIVLLGAQGMDAGKELIKSLISSEKKIFH